MPVCDKCDAQIAEGANFCPQCGDPVTEADYVSVPAETDAGTQIKLSFGYSSSRYYDEALRICERVPSFTTEGEGKEARHTLALAGEDVELARKVWDIVGGWKSSEMLLNGEQATKSDLSYGGMGCFRSRLKSPNRHQYCYGEREHEFNVWGCKRLGMPLIEWADWLEYGKFDSRGVWHFDKARIRQELERKMHEHRHCPVLHKADVLETLDRIPDTINPETDPRWEYKTRREYGDDYRSYKDVATGIRPVARNAAAYIVDEKKPNVPRREEREAHTRTINVKFDAGETPTRRRKRSTSQDSSGCAGVIVLLIAAGIILAFV